MFYVFLHSIITIAKVIEAQNNFDSAAYANCFAQTAVIFDEGKTHNALWRES
jgi:hypothetical protein